MDELLQEADVTGVGQDEEGLSLALSANRTGLLVKDIMIRDVVTASPPEPVLTVAERMFTRDVSCIVVTDEHRVVGILTQRDLIRGIVSQTDVLRAIQQRLPRERNTGSS